LLKVKITISYNGTKYYGSQIQPDYITIQSKLEEVFKVINITTLDVVVREFYATVDPVTKRPIEVPTSIYIN